MMEQNYSVLMSVYKREKAEYLDLAINSMMNQTIKPSDFVLVCDGPLTPGLELIVEKYKTAYPEIFQIVRLTENQGLGKALNEGLKYCRNELIARMDSDDISVKNRCELQLNKFNSTPQLALCSGDIAEFSSNCSDITGIRKVPEEYEDILKSSKKRNPMNHMAVMFQKSKVEEAGSYMSMNLFEDYYLWIRMLQIGCYAENIGTILVYARAGEGMVKRRGGLNYIKDIVAFQKSLLKSKFIHYFEFLENCSLRIIVSFLPSSIRGIIYQKALRKHRGNIHEKSIDAGSRFAK